MTLRGDKRGVAQKWASWCRVIPPGQTEPFNSLIFSQHGLITIFFPLTQVKTAPLTRLGWFVCWNRSRCDAQFEWMAWYLILILNHQHLRTLRDWEIVTGGRLSIALCSQSWLQPTLQTPHGFNFNLSQVQIMSFVTLWTSTWWLVVSRGPIEMIKPKNQQLSHGTSGTRKGRTNHT